ncbi:MAG: hypothetical protein JXA43_00015 [Candidatus Diapherotrites archaeon]|nr:hypothetical protein [Candidatus Diapherotrites archaeon]
MSKIHIGTIGFEPHIFLPVLTEGVDKLIVFRSSFPNDKTDAAIAHLKGMFTMQKPPVSSNMQNFEVFSLKKRAFIDLVNEIIDLVNKNTKPNDEVYVHIGGGLRLHATALLYASFFLERNIKIICTILPQEGLLEVHTFPAPPLQQIAKPKELKILTVLRNLEAHQGSDRPIRLADIANAFSKTIKERNGKNIVPGIHHHLKNLVEKGLIAFDSEKKEYKLTMMGNFLLHAQELT